MSRYFDTLLARPVAADDPDEQRLADALSAHQTGDGDHGTLLVELCERHLAAVTAPSDPLLMRVARVLESAVPAREQLPIWARLRARYPAHALVATLQLRAFLAAAESLLGEADPSVATASEPDSQPDRDDTHFEIRERYSELLEHYTGNVPATAELHELGRAIARLEASGVLPRVMVLRGAWRTSG